jgi:hypothetical protein
MADYDRPSRANPELATATGSNKNPSPAPASSVPLQRLNDLTSPPAPQSRAPLPAKLGAAVESLSGVSMRGVDVSYNSSDPSHYDALAIAKGRHIALGPGQERHLPHEAWHIAQQAQGRARGTTQLQGETISANPALESEADTMGARAAQLSRKAAPSAYESAADGLAKSAATTGIARESPQMNRALRPLATEGMIQRRVIATGATNKEANRQAIETIRTLLHSPALVGPASANQRGAKITLLRGQMQTKTYTYKYTSKQNITDYNLDTGAHKNKPTVELSHVSQRVNWARATTLSPGIKQLNSYSPIGNTGHGQVKAENLLLEPATSAVATPMSDWIHQLYDAWSSNWLNTGPLPVGATQVQKDALVQGLDKLRDLKNDALEIAARLDHPRADLMNNLVINNAGAIKSIKEAEDLQLAVDAMRAEAIANLNLAVADAAIPVVPRWGAPGPHQSGTWVKVTWPVGKLASTMQGQRTFDVGAGGGATNPEWVDMLENRREYGNVDRSGWIRGHLLNANLGGPARPYNLFPLWSNANKAHSAAAEEALKHLIHDYQNEWQGNRMVDLGTDPNAKVKYEVVTSGVGTVGKFNGITADWVLAAADLNTLNGNMDAAHGFHPASDLATIGAMKVGPVFKSLLQQKKDPVTHNALHVNAVPAAIASGGGALYKYMVAAKENALLQDWGWGNTATWAEFTLMVKGIKTQWKNEKATVPNKAEVTIDLDDGLGGGFVPLIDPSPTVISNQLGFRRFNDKIKKS